MQRLHSLDSREDRAETREGGGNMFQKLGAAVDMAEFAVRAESLHQALHRAAIVDRPEMRIIGALRPI